MIYMEEFWAEGSYEKDQASHNKYSGILPALVDQTKELWAEMGFDRPRVVFAKPFHSIGVAMYICGTCPTPIILIDAYDHTDTEFNELDEQQIICSIAHELNHAYLEHIGIETYLHPEKDIEQLARDWSDNLLTGKEIADCLDEIAKEIEEKLDTECVHA